MSERTENDTIAELARSAAAEVQLLGDGTDYLLGVVLPPGHQHHVIDLEKYQPQPRRKTGHVQLHDAVSFAAYVKRHRVDTTTTIYADHTWHSVVGVINDAGAGDEASGWGDHRASLTLRKTQPWEHWTAFDGEAMSQAQFAEHIEKGLPEIVEPAAAEMYELSQTFQARLGATFRQTGKLPDGRRALHFEETIEASAGEQGDLTIPKEIHLLLAPYEGGQDYDLVARLRYRIREAKLTLSYHLVRPEDVLKAAFDAAVSDIEKATDIPAFRGLAPVR